MRAIRALWRAETPQIAECLVIRVLDRHFDTGGIDDGVARFPIADVSLGDVVVEDGSQLIDYAVEMAPWSRFIDA